MISGKNNVGKSTILEGILLLFGHLNPGVFFQLNSFRGNAFINPVPQILWEPLFGNLDSTKELKISIVYEGKNSSLSLIRDETSLMSSLMSVLTHWHNENADSIKTREIVDNYLLKLSFQRDDYSETGVYRINASGISIDLASPPSPIGTIIKYYGTNATEDPNVVSEWFGIINLSEKKQQLMDILCLMGTDITDLFTVVSGGVGHIYADTKQWGKMPLYVMGGGINKLLSVALFMLAKPNSILLIDEVENGFHHSFHKKFWKSIFNVSRETNCQIFATTHSFECISGAVDAAEESVDGNALSYIRLGLKEDRIIPYSFSKESLAYAIRSEMEVR